MWYHSLVALLLTSILWISGCLETRTQLWMWAGFGILWGVTSLTTPVVLTVVPFLTAWVCYRLYRNGKVWKIPALTVALALIGTLAPWMVRNYRVFHRPVFLKDNFWMEVCVGNLGNATHWWNDAVHPAGQNGELAEFQKLGELSYMQRARELAVADIRLHPGIWAWRTIRRVVYMWTGFWSLEPAYLHEEPFDLPNIFFCTGFTIIALLGLRKAMRHSPTVAMPYILVLVSFPLAYYLTHSEISYRQPIDPELVVLASVAFFLRAKPIVHLPEAPNQKKISGTD